MKRIPLALLTLVTGAAPAAASQGSVSASAGIFCRQLGENFACVVECNARADQEESIDVPLATSIYCKINGIADSRVFPGPVAVIVEPRILPQVFEVCLRAEATFFDPIAQASYQVESGPEPDCNLVDLG